MTAFFGAYFPLLVVMTMQAFMIGLGGVAIAEGIHARRSLRPGRSLAAVPTRP